MNETKPQRVVQAKAFNSRNLIKTIFDDRNPEIAVRAVPAQSLYIAVRSQGIESCAELIEIATLEQCRLLLDFDCWSRDSFREDHFWQWLALTDATESLELLQKIVRVMDLKLVALMIARYVEVFASREQHDAPPGPNHFTPDKGRTWLALKTENPEHVFLLNRLLALLFESNSDLFYQILSIPSVATPSELEEESFQEKQKRLSSEGIPDQELAAELNSPLPTNLLLSEVQSKKTQATVQDIAAIEPVIYDGSFPEPLRSLVNQLMYSDDFESELTLLLNAAIVYFGVDLSEIQEVLEIAERVKGALNLGLEHGMQQSSQSAIDLYHVLGLRGLYRHGLSLLFSERSAARQKVREEHDTEHPAEMQLLIEGLQKRFPEMPTFIRDIPEATSGQDSREATFVPIQSLKELERIQKTLRG